MWQPCGLAFEAPVDVAHEVEDDGRTCLWLIGEQLVPSVAEHGQLSAWYLLDQLVGVSQGHHLVFGSVQDEGGAGDPRQLA